MSELKSRLTNDMKAAMKAGEKEKLQTIRSINAAIKQIEVDERVELDDARILTILEKLSKQRKDSLSQFEAANREDLASVERAELAIIRTYLPEQLSAEEIAKVVTDTIASIGANGMADMGKVMSAIKPILAGKADMGDVSAIIKKALTG